MTWFEALDILDGCAVGPMRDSRYRLEAIQVLAGLHTSGDEPPTALLIEADKAQLE